MIKFKTNVLESFLDQFVIDHYYLATVLGIWATLLLLVILFYLLRQSKSLRMMEQQNIHRMDLLRRIINAGHVYILIADKHGKIIDIHPDIQSLVGLQSSQVIGKDLKIFLEGTSIEEAGSFWKTIHDDKETYQLNFGGIWRDGEEFNIATQVRPIVLDDVVVGFVVMKLGAENTQEIQLSSRVDSELERAQAKEEAIVESIGEGVIVTDENDKVIMANKAAREIVGTKDDMEHKSIHEVLPLEDENNAMLLPQHHPLREALQNSRRVMTRSYHIVRDDFSKISLAITASPVAVDGKTVGGVVVFRDITKEKDVDRAKTEFVSLASHQLRTPLTTISWYTELMSGTGSENLTDTQRDYLKVIYDGNQRMVELVNALLNVSRLELGTFIIEPEPTQIIDLINSVLRDVEPLILSKKHEISFTYDESLNGIHIDPRLMRMIIQNLLTNSIKYTPENGKIIIDLQKRYPDMILKVSDNGFGIPADQQDRIFTKLFRADNVTVKNTEGTGLGLYIVKSILDRAGGRIWFDSEEDKGATFFVSIPLDGMKSKSGTKSLS